MSNEVPLMQKHTPGTRVKLLSDCPEGPEEGDIGTVVRVDPDVYSSDGPDEVYVAFGRLSYPLLLSLSALEVS